MQINGTKYKIQQDPKTHKRIRIFKKKKERENKDIRQIRNKWKKRSVNKQCWKNKNKKK